MTKFTDHIHTEILNIAEKNLNSDQGVSHDNFDIILTDISVCMKKLGIKENIISQSKKDKCSLINLGVGIFSALDGLRSLQKVDRFLHIAKPPPRYFFEYSFFQNASFYKVSCINRIDY